MKSISVYHNTKKVYTDDEIKKALDSLYQNVRKRSAPSNTSKITFHFTYNNRNQMIDVIATKNPNTGEPMQRVEVAATPEVHELSPQIKQILDQIDS